MESQATQAAPATDVPLLSLDDILAADDTRYAIVHVPEWRNAQGVEHVRIKSLSGAEIDEFRAAIAVETPAIGSRPATRRVEDKGLRARFVALAMVDAAGRSVYDQKAVEGLAKKSNAALQRVFDAATKLSHASDAHVEALGKGSAPTPGADS